LTGDGALGYCATRQEAPGVSQCSGSTEEELMGEEEEVLERGRRMGRREFLIAGAGAGLALASPINYAAVARARSLPIAKGGKFAYGVASGIPTTSGVTLWTRLNGLDRSSKLTVEVATDPNFRNVVAQRRDVVADAKRDFTVHTRIRGLTPAKQYHYRFETQSSDSRVGTFRTLPPPDSNQELRIAFCSCQSYEAGYYTPHAELAKEQDLDFVLFLGDYIYEHHYYDGPAGRVDKTGVNKDGDVQSLAEYRKKYRFYQSDKNLQDVHAAHPFVAIWDDHEVEDNYAGKHPDSASTDPAHFENNNNYARRVPFGQRRANGYKAFFEAMPRIQRASDPTKLYGSLRLGRMAELFLTDERQYRDVQPCNDVQLQACPDDMTPGRTFLGSTQKRWLKGAVPRSQARWNLFASETMMMALDSSPGVHANQDQWDGYSAEREEILSSFVSAGVENLVVLSGDIHTFIAGNLTTTGESTGTPVGVELVGGSLTSFGLPEELGIPAATLEALREASDPHTIYADFEHRGYGVITISQDEVIGEFKAVNSTQTRTSTPVTLAKFKVESGTPTLQQI
jgi:alkaline phosphatase D